MDEKRLRDLKSETGNNAYDLISALKEKSDVEFVEGMYWAVHDVCEQFRLYPAAGPVFSYLVDRVSTLEGDLKAAGLMTLTEFAFGTGEIPPDTVEQFESAFETYSSLIFTEIGKSLTAERDVLHGFAVIAARAGHKEMARVLPDIEIPR